MKTVQQMIEGPRAVREALAAAWALVHTIDQYDALMPDPLVAVKDDLRRKLERVDEIRTGRGA